MTKEQTKIALSIIIQMLENEISFKDLMEFKYRFDLDRTQKVD